MTHGRILISTVLALALLMVGCGGGGISSLAPASNTTPSSNLPAISSVTPDSAIIASPVTVRVTGSGFDSSSVIMFDGKTIPTTVVDSSTVSTTVPADSTSQPGDVNVVVSNTSTKVTSNALKFRWVKSLTITTTSLPSASQGSNYQLTLTSAGGKAPYTWTASGLPSGLSLSTSGTITGIPTASGSYSVVVTLSDSSSPVKTATQTLGLQVTPDPLVITASTLTAATVSKPYSATLSAKGGTAPRTWSISSGSLPAGLSLAPATGIVSGTPTADGNFNFTVSVTDTSSPAQKQSAATSIVVATAAAPQLSITSSTLPGGAVSKSYTGTLSATGGTAPYTWSVSSGSLPAGLSLAPATGIVSGTPSTSGTFNFTVSVSDSSSTVQKQSAATSVVVAAAVPPLAITAASLPSGAVGTSYSATAQATGGTPAYTWSVSSGQLPSGLTLAATTGEISGTPSASGTFNFSLKVTDNAVPPQSVTASQSVAIAAAAAKSTAGTTWYVRADGGTRYSANVLTGQCDGMSDTAYPGTGTNQHCAFNDVRYLWTDGTYTTDRNVGSPKWGWVIAGGDTVIIRGGPWRVGQSGPNAGDGFGLAGDPYGSGAPPIPSGASGQHTRILGENYSNCTRKTQVFGGYAAGQVFSLSGSQYVDLQCMELTDHGQCGRSGTGNNCASGYPIDDYAGNGLATSTGTANIWLTDMDIHGFASRGIIGPIGGDIWAERLRIAYNTGAGWDFDDGSGTNPSTGGTVHFWDSVIEWSGCTEEYPIVHTPSPYLCWDQNSGGYGDAIGTANNDAASFDIQRSIFRYNTQDGPDLLHSSNGTFSFKNSQSYGNMGQQIKLGAASTVVVQNSVFIHDCNRLSQAMPGARVGFNANLSNFCRAAGDGIVIGMKDGATWKFQANSYLGYGATTFDIVCSGTCTTPTITMEDNLMIARPNFADNQLPGPWYQGPGVPANPFASRRNNIWYNFRSCPMGGTNEVCTNPNVTSWAIGYSGIGGDESLFDSASMVLTSGSTNAIGAGVAISGLTTDFTGKTRPNPPSIGAFEQ